MHDYCVFKERHVSACFFNGVISLFSCSVTERSKFNRQNVVENRSM